MGPKVPEQSIWSCVLGGFMKPSGIGGQAVIEGIMMRNQNVYSVAVRKPDNEIEVVKKESQLLTEKHKWLNYPIIRGIFNFIDSLVLGMSTITYSASFYDEEPKEKEPTPVDTVAKAVFKDKLDSVLMAVTVLFSIAFAVVLFMLTPYFVSRLLSKIIVSKGVLNLIEGLIRVAIFIIYILAISMMKDIKRVFMYHGAEHKCINCVENGLELNVENVRISSRHHKRCGTSFLFFVMFVSVIFFIFISVDNPFWQIAIRLLLVPVIAGVSYELIRWAGRSENKFVEIISKPGMWLQSLTTREPDDDMIEVGIKAVEAVFDWKKFLKEYYEEIDINGIHETVADKADEAGQTTTAGDAIASKAAEPETFKQVIKEMSATAEAQDEAETEKAEAQMQDEDDLTEVADVKEDAQTENADSSKEAETASGQNSDASVDQQESETQKTDTIEDSIKENVDASDKAEALDNEDKTSDDGIQMMDQALEEPDESQYIEEEKVPTVKNKKSKKYKKKNKQNKQNNQNNKNSSENSNSESKKDMGK